MLGIGREITQGTVDHHLLPQCLVSLHFNTRELITKTFSYYLDYIYYSLILIMIMLICRNALLAQII